MERLLIILHEVHQTISESEVLKALPAGLHIIPRKIVSVKPITKDLDETNQINWNFLANEQLTIYNRDIKPLLQEKIKQRVIYFGFAPIPLAIHLGYLLKDWEEIEVFQHHHTLKDWAWHKKENFQFEIENTTLPQEDISGSGEVVLRLSTSIKIHPEDTRNIVTDYLKEIDISLTNCDFDAFETFKNLQLVAEKFKTSLDVVTQKIPKTKKINLFAAIPVGLAFLLGTKIQPNIHKFIQTYQYDGKKEFKYTPAILIQDIGETSIIPSNDEIKKAKLIRKESQNDLKNKVKSFLETFKENSNWYYYLNDNDNLFLKESFWNRLPPLSETSLLNDNIDLKNIIANDGFSYENNQWILSNDFIIPLIKRIKDEGDIMCSLRLFLFHEALHNKLHKVRSNNVRDIGSFPKILEEIDYQSDVYALLNEYGYEKLHNRANTEDALNFFKKTIPIAINTMWSFDDRGRELSQIQIRRLNRYLIWYWQKILIENAKSLSEVVKILAQKPLLEISGLNIVSSPNRVFYDLNSIGNIEIGVLYNNDVKRYGQATNLPLQNLIKGFRELNGNLITNTLKSLYDNIV